MKKMKSALALCLALLLTAGCGGKTVEQVDAGNYVVEMPGDVAKESQSIPIEISEIGLSSSMTDHDGNGGLFRRRNLHGRGGGLGATGAGL